MTPAILNATLKQAQSGFFDRKDVMSSVDKATHKVLSKFGAFVRRAARSSIKPQPKTARSKRFSKEKFFGQSVSIPGQPPFSHTGLLRDHIYFAYDKLSRSVVIGPIRLNQKRGGAPAALEYGGPSLATRGPRHRVINIRKRPYMQPAFEKELTNPKLNALWANSIRRAA